jgi:hypothetical protein
MGSRNKNKFMFEVLDEAERQGLVVAHQGDTYVVSPSGRVLRKLNAGETPGKDERAKKVRDRSLVANPVSGEFAYIATGPSDRRAVLNVISLLRHSLNFVWNGRGTSREH